MLLDVQFLISLTASLKIYHIFYNNFRAISLKLLRYVQIGIDTKSLKENTFMIDQIKSKTPGLLQA